MSLFLLGAAEKTPGLPPAPERPMVLQPSPLAHSLTSDFEELQLLRLSGRWSELATILRERLAGEGGLGSAQRAAWSLELAEALARLDRREEAILFLSEASRDPRLKAHDRTIAQRRAGALSRFFGSAGTAEKYQRALVHFQAGRLPDARLILQGIVAEEPAQLDALVRLGQICLIQQDWDSGVEPLRKARRLNPLEPVIALWLGKAMLERGELVDARLELLAALENGETREQAYEWLLELETRSGDSRALSKWIAQGVSRYPGSLSVWGGVLRSGGVLDGRQSRAFKAFQDGFRREAAKIEADSTGSSSERRFDDSGGLGCSWKTIEERRAELIQLLDVGLPGAPKSVGSHPIK